MPYLLPNTNSNPTSYTVFNELDYIPEFAQSEAIFIDALPEGSGVLRRANDGTFYYERTPEVTEPPELSLEEMQAQILLNTEYLVSRAELGLGGI